MNIKVFQNRKIEKCYFYNEGTQNENDSSILTFDVPQEYEDYIKRIVFITEDGNFWDYINENKYILKNNVTKYGILSAYLWLTKDTKDFRTEQFELNFYDNKNPDDVVPSEEQVDGFATMIKILEEKIDEVEVLKIDIGDFKQALGGKVDKKEGYGLSQNDFTNELKTTLENLENYDDTEIKASVENIKKDLTNYYRKSETYSKQEIDNKISKIPKLDIEVVDSLPTENISEEKLYLVKSGEESENLYTEYIYVNGKWEKLGEQKLNISHLATKVELEEVKTELNAEIERLTTENEQQQEQLDILNSEFEENTVEGESVSVTDGVPKTKISSIVNGNSYQETTEGYNLVNESSLISIKNVNTINGNLVTSIEITNKGTDYVSVDFDNFDLEVGDYYISVDARITNGSVESISSLQMLGNNLTVSGTGWINKPILSSVFQRVIRKYTISSVANTSIKRMLFQVSNPTNAILELKNFQISKVNKPYEPYTNGVATPNTEYPQEYEVIDGVNILNPSNLLLFNANKYIQTKTRIDVMPNTEYSIVSNKIFTDIGIKGYSDDTNYEKLTTTSIIKGNKRYYTFTTKANTKTLYFYIGQDTEYVTLEEYLKLLEVMFIKGTEVSYYLPYGHIGLVQRGKNYWNKGNLNNQSGDITIPFKSGDYTLSFIKKRIANSTITNNTLYRYARMKFYDKDNTLLQTISDKTTLTLSANSTSQRFSIPFTAPENTTKMMINFDNNNSDTNFNTEILDIQIEDGSTATPIEPYIEPKLIPINLNGNSIAKVGDIKDILNIGVDGSTKLPKNIKMRVFNGSENWIMYNRLVYIDIDDILSLGSGTNSNFYTNYFKYGSGRIYIGHSTGKRLHIDLDKVGLTDITTVALWKEWLSTHNLEFLYQTDDIKTIDLPSIEPIKLFEGTNVFELVTNLDTTMAVTYKVSNKKQIKDLQAQINELKTAIVTLGAV